jgi:hypothetical protein
MFSQWIEFTEEEERALDAVWEEIIAEAEAKRTAERNRERAETMARRLRTRKVGRYVHELSEAPATPATVAPQAQAPRLAIQAV